ncbi:MAG: hypothetical protein R3F40_06765 [Candidatus Competibacteraceae bacterium]
MINNQAHRQEHADHGAFLPRPLVMVDTALFTILDERLCLLLTQRKEPPFERKLALPGGFVHIDEDEDTEAAA